MGRKVTCLGVTGCRRRLPIPKDWLDQRRPLLGIILGGRRDVVVPDEAQNILDPDPGREDGMSCILA